MSNSPPESLFILPNTEEFIKPDFVENIGDKYNCVKCTQYLRPPVNQVQCGHRICGKCVTQVKHQGVNTKCPGNEEDCEKTDLTNPEHVYPDFGVVREMKSVKVFCANKDYGCQEVVPWSSLKTHMDGCKYKPVDCRYRDMGCPEKSTRDGIHEHILVCEYQPQVCPYCLYKVPMKEMKEGHEKKCASKPKPCDFKDLGCDFIAVKKEELLQHVEQEHYKHIKVLVDVYRDQKKSLDDLQATKQLMETNMAQLEGKNKQLERDLQEATRKNEKFTKDYADKMKRVMKITGTNTEKVNALEGNFGNFQEVKRVHESRINSLETSGRLLPSIPDDMKQRLAHLEQSMGSFNVRVAENELRFQCLETASYNGVLIWKIVDYRRRKQEAKDGKTLSLYSQPFYSSHFGYKMCCRVYLNGDGMGKGKHLSIFFVIMRGDFDDLLPWPFKQKVTLTLLDVETGRKHLSDTFRPDPTSTSFKKPTSEMNVASGCPLFAQHSSVESPAYLKNDTIYLKVAIDTSDLNMP